MTETFTLENPSEPPKGSRFQLLALFGVAGVLIVGMLLYLSPGEKHPAGPGAQAHLAFGPAEQAYAPSIQIENLTLTKNENFLQQEVTSLTGEVVNSGSRPLRDVEVTIEFFDDMRQVVLRETRAVLGGNPPAIAPGERREFEVSFEHIPSSWNTQHPGVKVTGISFASAKE